MTIAATNSASAGAVASTTGPSTLRALDSSSFIALLTAELKNQDPTKPMDPTQMVSQLATIGSVQQSVQMNATLTSLLAMSSLSQAEQLIGKRIDSPDGGSGVVTSVTVNGSGSTATLSDGSLIQVRDGLRVSNP